MKVKFEFKLLRARGKGIPEFWQLIKDQSPKDLDDFGAVCLAASSENLPLVQLLMDHGCDVDARTSAKRTALDSAIDYGNVELVELLLNLGADATLPDQRLLFNSARNIKGNGLAITKLLVAHGVDVNETFETWGGVLKSPLDWASGTPSIAEYLRSVGARTAEELGQEG